MNIKYQSIAGKNTLKDERLVLKVLSDTDIGEYALFQTGYQDGNVTSGVRNTYWFPDKKVKAGDLVVLYTKIGLQSDKLLNDKSTAHFFYWGLPNPIWTSKETAPVVLHISEWEAGKLD